jgi:hypothetical protein
MMMLPAIANMRKMPLFRIALEAQPITSRHTPKYKRYTERGNVGNCGRCRLDALLQTYILAKPLGNDRIVARSTLLSKNVTHHVRMTRAVGSKLTLHRQRQRTKIETAL